MYLELSYVIFNAIFTLKYNFLILYPKMSSVTTIRKILKHLCFSSAAATYLIDTCGIDSLDEIAYMDGIDKMDTTIKGVENPGGIGNNINRISSSYFA
jgi:hypothetical protein